MSVPDLEVVAIRSEEVAGHRHIVAVKLANGNEMTAAEVMKEIDMHNAHYTMRPPEGSPAYHEHQRTGLPLLVGIRDCPDCGAQVLYA